MARSRKRRKRRPRPQPADRGLGAQTSTEAEATSSQAASGRARRRSVHPRAADERPPAPWGSFPLVELVVLVALVLLVIGFFTSGSQGTLMIAVGLVLGSLAGLELSIREHFGGYRSHTLLLAGSVGVAVLIVLGLIGSGTVPGEVALAAAVLAGGGSGWALARLFRQRTGRSFKVR